MSLLSKFIIGEWNLGISNVDFISEFANIKPGGVLRIPIRWIKHCKPFSFFADPFIYKVDQWKIEILTEEFVYTRSKGVISLCTIDRTTGRLLHRQKILEEGCHLSYPFYDEVSHRIYPESFRNGHWANYYFDGEKVSDKRRVTDFPLIDATPVHWKGKWYIFATTQPKALSRLLIYMGDSPAGPFVPHPGNPVKEDIATSRPGGKCFVHDGQLFRIVQDSTGRYGEALHVMRVIELTPEIFKEEFHCDIIPENPSPYALGFHTLNFKGDIIIADGYRERFRPFLAVYIYRIVPFLRRIGLHR